MEAKGYKMHEIDAIDIAFYLELTLQDTAVEYVTADDLPWL